MDSCEATNVLISKIRSIDPENATKIMGYILIQDFSERDLLRLAFGPQTLLQNLILEAKTQLGLSPSTLSTPSSPSPVMANPIPRPYNASSNNPFAQSSPPLTNNGPLVDFSRSTSPHSWPAPGLANNSNNNSSISPKSSPFLSYDNIRAGSVLVPPFSKNAGNGGGVGGDSSSYSGELFDGHQLDEYLSFLDDSSSKNEEFVDPRVQLGGYPVNGDNHLHRRRFSESDACFGAEDGDFGIGCRPCLYFAKGFCKNGDNCKFVHSGFGSDNIMEVNGGDVILGSPKEMESLYLQQREQMMRMKAAQQQRLAYNKYMNFLLQQQSEPQRFGAAAAMDDEFHNFSQFGPERNGFLAMGMVERVNSASRQIYLTFPADSTFKDEDVSNYFSTFGPVQDVRIPYQQKRMFGFVTFVHPETVKLILARGNPHYICDSRVLVKPYKEKGKVANKGQQHLQPQLLDRGNFSPSSPSRLDPRELYDFHLGARMLHNTRELMLRRKLEEQAELQQAIELQGRKLINLQLPDLRGDYIHRHQRSLSVGAPISLPAHSPVNQTVILSSDCKNQAILEDNGDNSATTISPSVTAAKNIKEVNVSCIQNNGKEESPNHVEVAVHESHGSNVEHALPDTLFASPTKSCGNQYPNFYPAVTESNKRIESCVISSSENNAPVSTTPHDMASH